MATKTDIKRQVAQIQRNAKEILTRRIPMQVERALTTVGTIVANKAQEYTPVEYGILQNSQYRVVEATANGYQVAVGYIADYAAPLHNRTNWQPRPPDQKAGPAWNPNATPKFLERAGLEEQTTVTRIMLGDLEL